MAFKVIVAGGREFLDYELVKNKLDSILKNQSDIEIVSGKQRGADTLGENYAKEKGYKVESFPPDWDSYGKSAGYRRNKQMAEYADACVCFWDGKSKGTRNMIKLAKEYKLELRIVQYETK